MGRCAFRSVAILAALCAPGTARAEASSAEKATAEALYDEGTRLMGSAHYETACPKFAESQRIDPGIGTMMWLADCYGRIGRTASAWTLFREAASLADARGDPRAKLARQQALAIEPRLSKLVLVVPTPAPDGLVITRDGAAISSVAWGIELPIDVGEHTVSARAPGREAWETRLTLTAPGGRTVVTIPDLRAGDAARPDPTAPASPAVAKSAPQVASPTGGTQRAIGLAALGVGAVFVGVGSVYGLNAKSKLDDSNASGCSGTVCRDAFGRDLRSDATHAATVATLAFGVGLAVIVGGALTYLLAPRDVPPPVARLRVVPGRAPAGAGSGLVEAFKF